MDSVSAAMVTSFTSIVSSLESSLVSIVPLALGLIGIGLVVIIGIRKFKSVAKQA